MSCAKASRELLERFRFGEELDARSAPHLDHLQTCDACREAVGLDRALVMQLRRALQARVDGYAPSERAWDGVRQRALADAKPGSRWFGWLRPASTGLRAAGAVAAVAIVVVLGAQGDSGDGQVADFQLRATGRGELVRANAMPTDPPPREEPAPYRGGRAPLPPPAAGRMSVIMTYGETGEALATVHPAPRRISGLLQ